MMQFDPYLNWLGIPLHEQPANFYRMLGVVLFESNPQVIEQAADRQSLLVGAYQAGPQGELCQQLLSEIAMARFTLLDPQQKANYDAHLQGVLAQRGERAVLAPPPPSGMAIPSQFVSPSPSQFGQQPSPPRHSPQSGQPQFAPSQFMPPPPMPAMNPAMAMPPGPMPGAPFPQVMPGPMPQPQAALPRAFAPAQMPQGMPMPPMPQAQMPAMPQPAMRGNPQAMPGAAPFRPAMASMAAPAAIPVAAPFPTAARAAASGGAAAISPQSAPPDPPQRPFDEIERLSAQPGSRRRALKRKHKNDYTKEFVIGGMVAGFAALLVIIFLASGGVDSSKHGFEGSIEPNNSLSATTSPSSNEVREKEKEEKEKKEIEKKEKERRTHKPSDMAADHSSSEPGLREFPDAPNFPKKHTTSSDNGNIATKVPGAPPEAAPHNDAARTPPPVVSSPPSQQHDTPQDLGGDNDPVMELPQDDK